MKEKYSFIVSKIIRQVFYHVYHDKWTSTLIESGNQKSIPIHWCMKTPFSYYRSKYHIIRIVYPLLVFINSECSKQVPAQPAMSAWVSIAIYNQSLHTNRQTERERVCECVWESMSELCEAGARLWMTSLACTPAAVDSPWTLCSFRWHISIRRLSISSSSKVNIASPRPLSVPKGCLRSGKLPSAVNISCKS